MIHEVYALFTHKLKRISAREEYFLKDVSVSLAILQLLPSFAGFVDHFLGPFWVILYK